MTKTHLPRFGDPAARRIKQASTWSLVVYLIFMFVCTIAAGFASAQSFADGDPETAYFALACAIMIPAILIGAFVIVSAMWTPVLRAAQKLRAVYPEAVIVAARVPKPADEILGTTWPHLYRPLPSKVSVMVDEYGISLWSPTATESALVLFSWNDVENVIAAEHVELRLAVPGIALVAASRDVAFPLALYRRGPAIAYLIHGAELIDMAATIESMRPRR